MLVTLCNSYKIVTVKLHSHNYTVTHTSPQKIPCFCVIGVTTNYFSGLTELRKSLYCLITDMQITLMNSKVVFQVILKYLQNPPLPLSHLKYYDPPLNYCA
jgi:hypothetical protein